MGSREGIREYLTAMREEFDYWKTREECRIDIIGDNQSIHNYLYYTNRLKNARAVPHRTGPIHVVGYQAARIDEKLGGQDAKKEDDAWQRWLPEEYGIINQETGMIVNLDGTPSAQVHQYDRFSDHFMSKWFRMMIEKGWLYNRGNLTVE